MRPWQDAVKKEKETERAAKDAETAAVKKAEEKIKKKKKKKVKAAKDEV